MKGTQHDIAFFRQQVCRAERQRQGVGHAVAVCRATSLFVRLGIFLNSFLKDASGRIVSRGPLSRFFCRCVEVVLHEIPIRFRGILGSGGTPGGHGAAKGAPKEHRRRREGPRVNFSSILGVFWGPPGTPLGIVLAPKSPKSGKRAPGRPFWADPGEELDKTSHSGVPRMCQIVVFP